MVASERRIASSDSGSSFVSNYATASLQTRELGSSGPYAMLFCLDDLDKKKHRNVINSLKKSFF